MLIHPTLDQLRTLRLEGMARALEEQLQMDDIDDLRFEDRLALLLDREATTRASRRLQTRLRKPSCASPTPASKTSTIASGAAWTRACFWRSARASGSPSTATS